MKKRLLLFAILITMFSALSTGNAYAAARMEIWGPHILDYGNPDMLRLLRSAYADIGGSESTWIPYTIMITGAKDGEQRAEIGKRLREMLVASKQTRTFPTTIRIAVQGCDASTEKLAGDYTQNTADMLNDVKDEATFPQEFGPILIEWANEVNLFKEWGGENPKYDYMSQYSIFRARVLSNQGDKAYPFGPVHSSINTSNSDISAGKDSAWDAENFYGNISQGAFNRDAGVTSHPYKLEDDCATLQGGRGKERCSEMAWKYDRDKSVEKGLQVSPLYENSPLIVLTEYGPHPATSHYPGPNRVEQRRKALYEMWNNFNPGDYYGVRNITPLMYYDLGGDKSVDIFVFNSSNGAHSMPLAPVGEGFCHGLDCLIKGSALTIVDTIRPDGIGHTDVTRIDGLSVVVQPATGDIVASIQNPANPGSTKKSTRNVAANEPPPIASFIHEETLDGRYGLDVQCTPTTIKAICKDKVLETIHVDWGGAAAKDDPSGHYQKVIRVDLQYGKEIGDCTQTDEDLARVAKPLGTPVCTNTTYASDEGRASPDTQAYIWGRPSISRSAPNLIDIIKNCLGGGGPKPSKPEDIPGCIADIFDFSNIFQIWNFAHDLDTLFTRDVFTDWGSSYTANMHATGGGPLSTELQDCEQIRAANLRLNANSMKGAKLLFTNPYDQAEQSLGLQKANPNMEVCTKDGIPVKLSQIRPPNLEEARVESLKLSAAAAGTPINYLLSSDYYPKYLKTVKEGAAEGLRTGSIPKVEKEKDETFMCGGAYADEEDKGCQATKESLDTNPADDGSTSVPVELPGSNFSPFTKDATRGISMAFKMPPGSYSAGGNKPQTPEEAEGPTPAASSGISRTTVFGQNCVCPEGKEGDACRIGGIAFKLYKVIGTLQEAYDWASRCLIQGSGCRAAVDSETYIKPQYVDQGNMGKDYSIANESMLIPGYKKPTIDGCINATSGTLETTDRNIPSIQSDCGAAESLGGVIRKNLMSPDKKEEIK